MKNKAPKGDKKEVANAHLKKKESKLIYQVAALCGVEMVRSAPDRIIHLDPVTQGSSRCAQWKRIRLVSMKMWVLSVALLIGSGPIVAVSSDVGCRCILDPVLLLLWCRQLQL